MRKQVSILIIAIIFSCCDKNIHDFLVYGEFTDSRDSMEYSTVQIGSQTWMIDNLAFLPETDSLNDSSMVFPRHYLLEIEQDTIEPVDSVYFYEEYGVLYNWMAALSACPEGWKLPRDQDWKILESYLGMKNQEIDEADWRLSGNVDIRLKAAYGWEENGNGDNESGFSAFPASFLDPGDEYEQPGRGAYFWSSTSDLSTGKVWFRGLRSDENGVLRLTAHRSRAMSVRCIKI